MNPLLDILFGLLLGLWLLHEHITGKRPKWRIIWIFYVITMAHSIANYESIYS